MAVVVAESNHDELPPRRNDSRSAGMAESWQFHDDQASELPVGARDAARVLFIDALGHGNVALINQLFGVSKGTPHCHRSGHNLEPSLLKQYRCVAVMAGELGCIAAAVYRHWCPPRRVATPAFSELLLLAVETTLRCKGFGFVPRV